MSITYRSIKGSELTHAELDDNFQTLVDAIANLPANPTAAQVIAAIDDVYGNTNWRTQLSATDIETLLDIRYNGTDWRTQLSAAGIETLLDNRYGGTIWRDKPANGTVGTVLVLANPMGTYYSMASASSAATYTTVGSVLGGYAQVLVNRSAEPTVTGATKIKGAAFVASTNMYMIVTYNGERVEYYFVEI